MTNFYNGLRCFDAIFDNMKLKYWLITTTVILFGCKNNVQVNQSNKPIEETLGLLMQEAIDNSFDQIPGLAMTIISDDLPEGTWSGVIGYDSKQKEDTMTIHQPFRIASVTKSFVAMSILRLHEMDSLSIDDPLSKHISQSHIDILRQDDYDLDQILIKHCLNHTSGFFDYATNHDAYIQACTEKPDKRWTRTEQLKGAVKWGDKQGTPGEKYLYCDTGYILLGEIIENFYDGDLAKGLRELLKFEELALNSTWLETLEPSPLENHEPVHRYLGQLDATTWDASVDLYGGGGLMSTTDDLAKFIHALFNHQVFDDPSTLELMKTKPVYAATYDPEEDDRYSDYRYGLWEFPLYGMKAYAHSGLWGSDMIHIPELNLSLASNITRGRNPRMKKKAVLAIINSRLKKINE